MQKGAASAIYLHQAFLKRYMLSHPDFSWVATSGHVSVTSCAAVIAFVMRRTQSRWGRDESCRAAWAGRSTSYHTTSKPNQKQSFAWSLGTSAVLFFHEPSVSQHSPAISLWAMFNLLNCFIYHDHKGALKFEMYYVTEKCMLGEGELSCCCCHY